MINHIAEVSTNGSSQPMTAEQRQAACVAEVNAVLVKYSCAISTVQIIVDGVPQPMEMRIIAK